MAQNRKAPAYQEYSASMLSNMKFRLMSLDERGLFYTMRLECWENKQLPSSIQELATYLGRDVEAIKKALTERVKSFFIESDGLFTCPELDDYRQHLEERKAKQSLGGKFGSAATNRKANRSRKTASQGDSSNSPSNSQVPHQGGVDYLVKSSTEKPSQEQLRNISDINNWVNDYDKGDNSLVENDYSRRKG